MDMTGNFGSAALQFLDVLQDLAPQPSNFKRRVKASLSATLALNHAGHIRAFKELIAEPSVQGGIRRENMVPFVPAV
jgi:hypothetical protein